MMFWRLLLGTVAMLAFGYAGEAQFVNPWVGFCAGMCGWFFILFEIFAGEAGSTASGCFFQHHASHRHSGLVYLPYGLFLRISHGQRRGCHSEFREQDRFLPCYLAFCQEVHPRKGRCSPPPTVRSPINLIIEAWCRISKASRYLLLWPFSSALMHTTLSSRVP